MKGDDEARQPHAELDAHCYWKFGHAGIEQRTNRSARSWA